MEIKPWNEISRKPIFFLMEEKSLHALSRQQKTLKSLTLALIFSGALNISLIATGIFSSWKKHEISFEIPQPVGKEHKEESTNQQILRSFSHLGYRELVSYLTNRTQVEEGYTKRDLALASLVFYHHFNIEKALGSLPQQQRVIEMDFDEESNQNFALFPGLNEEQFEAIIRFAYQEKWPLTAEGLFHILKHRLAHRDPTLEQAFFTTPEFYAVQVLFQKTGAILPPTLLLDLICDGGWDPLNRLAKEQAQMLDLSVEKRRRFLLSYLALHSPVAAQLLLVTDFSFAVKKLEDQGISDLLRLLTKTPEAERFCIELLKQPRTDRIWQTAALRLYEFAGEAPPSPFDIKIAMARFTNVPIVTTTAPPPVEPVSQSSVPKTEAMRSHVVKEGENLWKIARLYKIPVDEIVKYNALEKDRLYPGMTLKIPRSSSPR